MWKLSIIKQAHLDVWTGHEAHRRQQFCNVLDGSLTYCRLRYNQTAKTNLAIKSNKWYQPYHTHSIHLFHLKDTIRFILLSRLDMGISNADSVCPDSLSGLDLLPKPHHVVLFILIAELSSWAELWKAELCSNHSQLMWQAGSQTNVCQ